MTRVAAQRSQLADSKTKIALKFVHQVWVSRGQVIDAQVAALHQAGYFNEEAVERVGHIAINLFTSYFSNMKTELDFSKAQLVSPHR